MTDSTDCKNKVKEWLIEIMEHVEPDEADSILGCICRVPEDIRRINEDAYTPKLISIGPLHHGKDKLADMEKRKKIYLKSFFGRLPPENVAKKEEEIITFVQENEKRIRDFYAEPIWWLEGTMFVVMIICDAISIIEHFLRTCIDDRFWLGDRCNKLLHTPHLQSAISLDLILLENQLPFFVLNGIYNLVFEENISFMEISIRFFEYAFNLDFHYQPKAHHFTDLIRISLVQSCPKVELQGPIRDLPCARELHKSGIKFKYSEREGLLDIRFEKRKQLGGCFQVQELLMPRFTMYDTTEYLLGNVMALEQYYYPLDTRVCNYVRLMNYLIKTNKDVELLVTEEIISNVYGEHGKIAHMFTKLDSQIILDECSSYYHICEELKAHYRNPSNKTKASLEKVFTNILTGAATMVAVIALFLTLIQTICSIVQVQSEKRN